MTARTASTAMTSVEYRGRQLRFAGSQATLTLDLDAGASVISWVPREVPVELMFQPPTTGPYKDVTGWYVLLPNAGPGGRANGIDYSRHGDIRTKAWKLDDARVDPDGWSILMTVSSSEVPLSVERRLQIDASGTRCRMTEVLRNVGGDPIEFLWGHHVTFSDRLADGARIWSSAQRWTSLPHYQPLLSQLDLGASGPLDRLPGHTRPSIDCSVVDTTSTQEMLFSSRLREGRAAVNNDRLGLQVEIVWDETILPFLWLWQHNGDTECGRGLALEPQSSDVPGMQDAFNSGRSMRLEVGEERELYISLELTQLAALDHRYPTT